MLLDLHTFVVSDGGLRGVVGHVSVILWFCVCPSARLIAGSLGCQKTQRVRVPQVVRLSVVSETCVRGAGGVVESVVLEFW